jgi:hypothetical protein
LDKTIVTEDSRIFLQCLVRYDGDYETVPMYIPVYMDTVDIGDFRRSLVNQYKQMRRWAWEWNIFPGWLNSFGLRTARQKGAIGTQIALFMESDGRSVFLGDRPVGNFFDWLFAVVAGFTTRIDQPHFFRMLLISCLH